jgi:hypothetical protein
VERVRFLLDELRHGKSASFPQLQRQRQHTDPHGDLHPLRRTNGRGIVLRDARDDAVVLLVFVVQPQEQSVMQQHSRLQLPHLLRALVIMFGASVEYMEGDSFPKRNILHVSLRFWAHDDFPYL